VFWCAFSRKKHKNYSDGVLLVRSGSAAVVLLDEEGKEIGKSSTVGHSTTTALAPGSQLLLGGKEIEVDKEVPFAEFESGSLFVKATAPTAGHSAATRPTRLQKVASAPRAVRVVQPRHDPAAPGALVLDAVSAVAVVLDPYVVQHLRAHQREGIRFMYECVMGKRSGGCGCILADEMGLGKSLQAIALLWTLLKQGPTGQPTIRKAIVVCPNTLIDNWVKEVKRWLGPERLRSLTLGDTKSKVQAAQVLKDFTADVHPLLIISYEQLRNNIAAIDPAACELLICDEAHRIKNPQCKTAQALTRLTAKRKVLLTGTPVQNDLTEFYTMVDFCNPGMLGTPTAFRNTFERPIGEGNDPRATAEQRELGRERAASLASLTSSLVIRRLSTILADYLPPKHELVLVCRPTEAQLEIYRRLLTSQCIRDLLLGEGRGMPALACLQRLVKICNHPALLLCSGDDTATGATVEGSEAAELGLTSILPDGYNPATSEDPLVELSGKMTLLDGMLKEIRTKTSEKVVLISNFTRTLDWFERLCKARGYKFARLDGQTEKAKR
jgi:DNA repair and recombination protein RAD54B